MAFLPDFDKLEFETPSLQLQPPNPQFSVPKPTPRTNAPLFSRPFLFRLASSDKSTGLERESRLLVRYEDILHGLGPGRLPEVTVDTSLGMAVVKVGGDNFATVLPQDCPEYAARIPEDRKLQLEEEVAYSWANEIRSDLQKQSIKRHPTYLTLYNYLTLCFFFVTALVHLSLGWVSRNYVKQPLWGLKLFAWILYFTAVTEFHPGLDNLAYLLGRGALRPLLGMFFCIVPAGVLHQLTVVLMNHFFREWATLEGESAQQRTAQQRQTVQQAAVFVSKLFWVFVGICAFLFAMGYDLTSFFAGAGLVSVGVGLIAKDLLMDFVNGVNIISEDQFGLGDWIESETDQGEVVEFSLRATKIRRIDGSLVTLPNSDLRRVKNHSNQWGNADFRVTVAYATDTDRALELILEEAALLQEEWPGNILEAPDPMGINELGLDGVVLRVMLKTAPLVQWQAGRRLNRRVKVRFQQEGIEFAAQRRLVQFENASSRDLRGCPPTLPPPEPPNAPP